MYTGRSALGSGESEERRHGASEIDYSVTEVCKDGYRTVANETEQTAVSGTEQSELRLFRQKSSTPALDRQRTVKVAQGMGCEAVLRSEGCSRMSNCKRGEKRCPFEPTVI